MCNRATWRSPSTPATRRRSGPAIPRFQSLVRGVRVLPGGGWSIGQVRNSSLSGCQNGSLYLFSDSAQLIQLQLQKVSTVPQTTVGLFEANGQSVPTTIGHDTIQADLDLRRGVTRIDLVTEPNAAAHRRLLILSEVTLRSAGS